MAVDLHTHSSYSDGSDSPSHLVERAAALGLEALALTDHDTIDGVPEALAAGSAAGIEVVPGIEVSLAWPKGGMHLVVLWLAHGPGPLQDRLAAVRESRTARNHLIVERLCDLGMAITIDEVEAESAGGVTGRPHIAAVMVRRGYVPDPETAFALYLGNNGPAYVGRERLDPEAAIRLARDSGGVPVLAHPHTLGIDNRLEMADLLERLIAAGLVGIESHYGTYDAAGRAGMVAMARRFGLVPSGGSDYHGTYKTDIALGTGRVGIPVPSDVLEDLRAERPSLATG
jgi:hypothetical protein